MRRKRTLVITLLVLLLLFVPPVWITYREYRQARLNHALIEAIKAGDDTKALEALAEGASGEARDTGAPPTLREALLHLWDRIRYPGSASSPSTSYYRSDPIKDYFQHLPPLVGLYVYPGAGFDGELGGIAEVSPSKSPNPALVRALLDHGAQVNEQDGAGNTALHYAAQFSDEEIVRLLLERGADIEAKGSDEYTPLMQASLASVESTKVLLEHGANPNAMDSGQNTPLIDAVINHRLDTVRLLLEHGAKVCRVETALN